MKIAVVGTRNLPANYGGVETACENLYLELVKMGVKVKVYCRSDSFKVWRDTVQGVQVLNFPVPEIPGVATFLHSFIAALLATFSDADIIHFHAQGPAFFTFIPRWLAPRKKVVFTCQGIDWQRDKWGHLARTVIRQGERHSVRYTDARIMVSNSLKSHYLETYGPIQAATIYNGVHLPRAVDTQSFLERFGLESGKYLLFIGRLVPEKAPDILIQAFNDLNTDIKLVIAGDSPETPEYVAQLRALAQNNPNILMTGNIRGQDVAEAYHHAMAYVSPSKLEGHPITALEAMSYGKPVLLSDIGPHQEILDCYTSPLPSFETGSVAACTHALQTLLELPSEQLQTVAHQSQQVVRENYLWPSVAQSVLGVYQACLGSAPRAENTAPSLAQVS